VQAGEFRILIVQPEQLQPFGGHLPRLAQVLRHTRFSKLVKQVHIDEAHTIYTAGIPLHGQPAFRPAWGHLGELRLWLPKNTPFQALSGTLPRHIIDCVTDKLLFQSDYISIHLTLNRPNITYATYPITGLPSNLRNLQFLVPDHRDHSFAPKLIPKTVVFHDNLQEATNAANYLNSLFPESMRHLRIAKHYHSVMSADYLEQTFQDFAASDGVTRILCATSGASTVRVNLYTFSTGFPPFILGSRRTRHRMRYSVWHVQRCPESHSARWPWWPFNINFRVLPDTL
jgi:superfamily II DNA helicase RecQ